jgi:hypothetical protein
MSCSESDWDSSGGDVSVSTVYLQPDLFVPVSEIKSARRRAVLSLMESLRKHEKDKGVSLWPLSLANCSSLLLLLLLLLLLPQSSSLCPPPYLSPSFTAIYII